eukprot:CAMPEP_0119314622 /NCGR_PEP_ID=MMETSP1333-20130426/33391_1 /TAXON_ID=418940 /ORGANISM="Scyphosphaera apsteinii, Strain RCC1455" /LENGTH=169 /DNA_ID=CAMNT_0007319771 /DNA_START=44 /DNA_END=553 /DNA_ORIENTATION=+
MAMRIVLATCVVACQAFSKVRPVDAELGAVYADCSSVESALANDHKLGGAFNQAKDYLIGDCIPNLGAVLRSGGDQDAAVTNCVTDKLFQPFLKSTSFWAWAANELCRIYDTDITAPAEEKYHLGPAADRALDTALANTQKAILPLLPSSCQGAKDFCIKVGYAYSIGR